MKTYFYLSVIIYFIASFVFVCACMCSCAGSSGHRVYEVTGQLSGDCRFFPSTTWTPGIGLMSLHLLVSSFTSGAILLAMNAALWSVSHLTKRTSTLWFSPGCFRIEMFQAMKRCLHMCTSDQHCILPDTSCPHLGQLFVSLPLCPHPNLCST